MSDNDQSGLPEPNEISRRKALQVIGGTTAGAAVVPRLALPAGVSRSGLAEALRLAASRARPAATPSLAFQAIRVEDMLYLGFEFYNAHSKVVSGQTYIVPTDTSQPTIMVVVFPPQHLGEETIPYPFVPPLTTWPVPPTFGQGALAGYSWLAFEVHPHSSVPFTIEGLLNWSSMRPQLVPVASGLKGSGPHAPDSMHTALEVPWSLWLTPSPTGTWHHSPTAVVSAGRAELWHTRLGVLGLEPPLVTPELKAFWARGYGATLSGPPPDPFLMSLTVSERIAIVELTCSVISGGAPAAANFLALTALGASINVEGHWVPGPNSGISISEWVHRTSTGRDSYVRIVRLGYLFPFGNRAVYVQITDREFQADPNAAIVAYLVTKVYIVVTEPVITFTGDTKEPHGGRGNPIRRIEVKTLTTPPIDTSIKQDPGIQVDPSLDPTLVLWVRSENKDIPFSFTATDSEHRSVDFTTSVIWLDETQTPGSVGTINSAYGKASPSRNSPSFGGSLFAFADTTGAKRGSTAHYVDNYTLQTYSATNGAANFYPALSSAVVHLPGAEQVVGAGSTPLPAPSVSISDNYLDNGFQSGVTEIYLAVESNGPGLSFPPSLVGGMAAPNFDVTGLARDIGPVAGKLSDLLSGKFDPTSYFSMISGSVGKLLGALPISEIIQSVPPPPAGAIRPAVDGPTPNSQAPQLTYSFVYPNNDDTKPPTAIDAKLTWNPSVTGANTAGFLVTDVNGTTNLLITAEIHAPISSPGQTTYAIHGELTYFQLVLFGDMPSAEVASFIGITFTSFTFDSKTGAKTSIKPQIDSVSFLGPLTFIQDLETLLSSLGGPSIDVTAAGIDASYTLALPDIGVGIFSLSNLSISGGVNIPFDGSPVRVRFALCTQENPFLLTIYVFGGGGYFSLAIGADGIEEIQVELEFGAAISIDLGVASGGVSIMAGIYFSLQTVPTRQVQLTGFLKADGNLSVLGIIQMSMEFYLSLTYLDPGQCYGTATVSVSVSVLFFSVSVSATMTKTFGGGSDPDFKDAITQANWDSYCEAFAT